MQAGEQQKHLPGPQGCPQGAEGPSGWMSHPAGHGHTVGQILPRTEP